MTIDDVPMDELDLAIRREAATLRNQLATSAHTDEAWDDFLVGHASSRSAAAQPTDVAADVWPSPSGRSQP